MYWADSTGRRNTFNQGGVYGATCRVDTEIDVNALEVFADERQSGMGAEVVGQFFDNKIGHVGAHLLGE